MAQMNSPQDTVHHLFFQPYLARLENLEGDGAYKDRYPDSTLTEWRADRRLLYIISFSTSTFCCCHYNNTETNFSEAFMDHCCRSCGHPDVIRVAGDWTTPRTGKEMLSTKIANDFNKHVRWRNGRREIVQQRFGKTANSDRSAVHLHRIT